MKKLYVFLLSILIIQTDGVAQLSNPVYSYLHEYGMMTSTTFTSSNQTNTLCTENTNVSAVCVSAPVSSDITLAMKVMLSGPYDASLGLMNDSLRINNMIPMDEPYSALPYLKPAIGCAAGETVTPAILSVTGQNAIIDWIFIELRSPVNAMNIIATKRALLQRDGDVVSELDGISPVSFPGIVPGNYCVSVKHRTHLGVMTKSAVTFIMGTDAIVDFTSESVWQLAGVYNEPRKILGSIYVLWSADANRNKNTKYNGTSNDKQDVLNAIGSGSINNILFPVYRPEDLNMDARVKYNNISSDRNEIILTVGTATLNNVVFQHLPN